VGALDLRSNVPAHFDGKHPGKSGVASLVRLTSMVPLSRERYISNLDIKTPSI
jgi:hypothetical protein